MQTEKKYTGLWCFLLIIYFGLLFLYNLGNGFGLRQALGHMSDSSLRIGVTNIVFMVLQFGGFLMSIALIVWLLRNHFTRALSSRRKPASAMRSPLQETIPDDLHHLRMNRVHVAADVSRSAAVPRSTL